MIKKNEKLFGGNISLSEVSVIMQHTILDNKVVIINTRITHLSVFS